MRLAWLLCVAGAVGAHPARAQDASTANTTPNTIVVDDFETGVAAWTRNDSVKTRNAAAEVLLADVTATRPPAAGLPRELAASRGAALFSFKAAKGAWASVSTPVSGARWAAIGARSLSFWLSGDGAAQGTELVLQATARRPDGASRLESFSVPVKLGNRGWRRVVIPLANFKNRNGSLLPHLGGVRLLQFAQRGAWESRFFTVDEIEVTGTGIPLAQRARAASSPAAAANSAAAAPGVAPRVLKTAQVQVNVDYLRRQGRVRTAANVSIGAALRGATLGTRFPMAANAQFRRAIEVLAPRLIRLDAAGLVQLVDSSRPAFDYGRLVAAARQTRSLGAEPLVALTNEPTWGLDERGYAAFAAGAARAVNATNPRLVRLFELATAAAPASAVAGGTAPGDTEAAAFYNSARAAIKALSRAYRVGGIGASSGRTGTLQTLLSRAQGLDFLSVQYFGASGATPAEAALFSAARDLKNLRAAAAALDRSRFRNALLYVTQSNLSAPVAVPGVGTGAAQAASTQTVATGDERTSQVAAAWWAAFLGSSSRLVDQVFHSDAVNPEAGLLNKDGAADLQGRIKIAFPAYYALWMWNTFFPAGSERVYAAASRNDVTLLAANTPSAHNLLLVNTQSKNTTVRVAIRGFPVLRAAYAHLLEDPQKGVRRFVPLPKSPFQTITLRPHAVAVIQFIEPPRRR